MVAPRLAVGESLTSSPVSVPSNESRAEAQVTFETKCWEGDWRYLLKRGGLERLIASEPFPFAHRVLYINNVERPAQVLTDANRLVNHGIIDEVVLASDYADAALRRFGLSRDGLGRGYVYSICELVGVHLARTPYLVHFAGDCLMADRGSWIEQGIALLTERPEVAVVNPVWNRRYGEVQDGATATDEHWWYGDGFSDQCYLVRPADFDQPIYGFTHPDSDRYPEYGGELFEKRVDSWMRHTGRIRAFHQTSSYSHDSSRAMTNWQRLRRRLAR